MARLCPRLKRFVTKGQWIFGIESQRHLSNSLASLTHLQELSLDFDAGHDDCSDFFSAISSLRLEKLSLFILTFGELGITQILHLILGNAASVVPNLSAFLQQFGEDFSKIELDIGNRTSICQTLKVLKLLDCLEQSKISLLLLRHLTVLNELIVGRHDMAESVQELYDPTGSSDSVSHYQVSRQAASGFNGTLKWSLNQRPGNQIFLSILILHQTNFLNLFFYLKVFYS